MNEINNHCSMQAKPVVGIDFDLEIKLDTIGEQWNLGNTEWDIEVFASPVKVVKFTKDQAKKINDNTYSLPIQTKKIGHGRYQAILSIKIPDTSFESGYRIESWKKDTGIIIYQKYV